MLATLRHWFTRQAAPRPWADVEAWAKAGAHRFTRTAEGDGFTVDGSTAGKPWRLEWGAPQRAYIGGPELRIRMELGLPLALQMLLLSRGLLESLETEIFERSTADLHTHVDMSTPEEMRWLSIFARAPLSTQPALRAHFGGVSSQPALLGGWVADELAQRLEAALPSLLKAAPPFMLMTLRGRLYLRMRLDDPVSHAVDQAAGLFEAAVLSGLQVAAAWRSEGDGWPSEGATAWQTQYPGQYPAQDPSDPPELR